MDNDLEELVEVTITLAPVHSIQCSCGNKFSISVDEWDGAKAAESHAGPSVDICIFCPSCICHVRIGEWSIMDQDGKGE